MSKNNPYHKRCPHCRKEFNARRLNQVYCTYFCKVQFNNEKNRLRRLELLKLEEKYQAINQQQPTFTTPQVCPKNDLEKPQKLEQSKNEKLLSLKKIPVSILRKIPNTYWAVGGISLFVLMLYYFFNSKKVTPSKAHQIASVPKNKMESIVNTENLKIPIDIAIKESSSKLQSQENEIRGDQNRSKLLVEFSYESHPDVVAYQKIIGLESNSPTDSS